MSSDASEIFAAALTLPESDRADLAFQLLGTLRPPIVQDEDHKGFSGELERRVAGFEAGKTAAASIDDVTDRVRNALHSRKSS